MYCALGWACWRTYVGRPEEDQVRGMAMAVLGNGLYGAKHYEDTLTVQEVRLSTMRRLGAPEAHILAVQSNLACTYASNRRFEEALQIERGVYSGRMKLNGEEHKETLRAAFNYALSLFNLKRFEEAKSLMCKTIPIARRVLGKCDIVTLGMRRCYARALYQNECATLDDLREAVTTLEDLERTARRVLGTLHPTTTGIEATLRYSRAALRAREMPPPAAAAEEDEEDDDCYEVSLGMRPGDSA